MTSTGVSKFLFWLVVGGWALWCMYDNDCYFTTSILAGCWWLGIVLGGLGLLLGGWGWLKMVLEGFGRVVCVRRVYV